MGFVPESHVFTSYVFAYKKMFDNYMKSGYIRVVGLT